MSALIRALRGRTGNRDWPTIPGGLDGLLQQVGFNGLSYPLVPRYTLTQEQEEPPDSFTGYARQLYGSNGIIFALVGVRMSIFSQARFQLRRKTTGETFGSAVLAPLEKPWGPASTTGDLLARLEQDVSLAGNAFVARLPGGVLAHMRPDWVTVVAGSRMSADRNPNWQLDAEVIGYLYWPGGKGSGEDPIALLPQNVAHYIETPDPTMRFVGMSWITPIVTEILGDKAAMEHKWKFFVNGATVNLVVSLGENVTPENFQKFVQLFEEQQAGVTNAYSTLFFGGGADAKTVGSDMKQLDFKVTQGHGETRMAAAAGVPPIVAGLSEGLEASTYSNYSQARRAFGDSKMRPLWSRVCGSLEPLIDLASVNAGAVTPSELWYDDKHIPFLQADVAENATILQAQAATTASLIQAGFQPDDVIKAVTAGDLSQLKGSHSGLVSVQLFQPGQGPDGNANGNGNGKKDMPMLPSGN